MPPKRLTHCKECGILLDESNTVWVNASSRYNSCRECIKKKDREYYKKRCNDEPEKVLEFKQRLRDNNIRWKFNMSLEEYNKRTELQHGLCAICFQPCKTGRGLSIDHNHLTGEIRDLLCARCNTVIGMVDEDKSLLLSMIHYIKKHESVDTEKTS